MTSGYLQEFDRMVFQRLDKKANAGRFERGCLNVTTENLTSWTWLRREKQPKTIF